ncbi:MAG: hypothetical protein HON53_12470 [Planctomycetaceae bacterium]|jgi:hypothetical protein|nr:hypothetical protein [Planctomycetaceae bacterium]MBT6154642.1 hypothetical protein [Planctomycetaceae bacterium]MBT6485365.1 hypothetical protein [Planctomycetaceae bacterium]MBT6495437.1 hypothetical protein [Planctomycetaceae bacterium]
MYKSFCTLALVAIAGAAGCQSHPKQCQHCSNATIGTAHVQCDPSTGTCPSPCAPIAVPVEVVEEEPVVEETVVQKRQEPVAPVRVAALPQPPLPRSGTVYGRGDNYVWLVGKLHRVHVPGGDWKIRFLELDQIDTHGGSMVLAPDIRLDEFSDGDCVYIEGEILAERPSLYLSGPLYRVRKVRTVTIADRRLVARTRLASNKDR